MKSKRAQPLKRASVQEERLRGLIEEIRREQAALLSEIREGFRTLGLVLAQEGYAVPASLCEKLYAAIYRIVGAVPFTATRLLEEAKESTSDALSLREALAAVLPMDSVTSNKLTRFLTWEAIPEAGAWCKCVSRHRSGEGRLFQVYRRDEK